MYLFFNVPPAAFRCVGKDISCVPTAGSKREGTPLGASGGGVGAMAIMIVRLINTQIVAYYIYGVLRSYLN
jgi:hypothetical protein